MLSESTDLAALIVKALGNKAFRRNIRRDKAFSIAMPLPDKIRSQLKRLEKTEHQRKASRN